MKTKLNDGRDGASADARRSFMIETDEDCQLARDRLDTMKAEGPDADSRDEVEALQAAIARWHARKKA
jgi:hypothetical protein